jgi:actin-related protein
MVRERHCAAKYQGRNMNDQALIAPPERKYSVWIGGSIQASLTDVPADVDVSKERVR